MRRGHNGSRARSPRVGVGFTRSAAINPIPPTPTPNPTPTPTSSSGDGAQRRVARRWQRLCFMVSPYSGVMSNVSPGTAWKWSLWTEDGQKEFGGIGTQEAVRVEVTIFWTKFVKRALRSTNFFMVVLGRNRRRGMKSVGLPLPTTFTNSLLRLTRLSSSWSSWS
ncbi:hypothetical protein CRUP_025601 [Coryphaenoides rupestris]|nr:hypothetical protein CRUP_025601 [Coryphaenoides rupestris]